MDQQQDQIHLQDYLHIILKRRWIILTIFVIVATVSIIGTFKTRPVFRSTAQLLIEKETNTSSYQEGVTIDISAMDYYQTQYKIIKSRTLARKVIEELRLDKIEEFQSKDTVTAFLKHIYVEPIRGSRLVNLSAESFSPALACNIANKLAEMYVKMNLEYQLYSSKELLKKITGKDIDNYTKMEETSIQSLPSVVKNSLIQSLKIDLAKYETEYAELSKRYKDTHPKMLGLRAQVQQIKQKISQETDKIIESIKTELSGNLKSNNIRIIDLAEIPDNPIKPKKRQNIILAVFLGLFLGAGLAFFIEYLDNTIKTDKEIEEYLGLVCLGLIPKIKIKNPKNPQEIKEKNLFVQYQPKSPSTESIKMIRTSITLSKPKDKLKTLLITSAGPGEGKTFATVNIALTFVQNSEKILIVDCDLRRSNVHKLFDINNDTGMSNYLVDETELEPIIKKTEIPNLDVITAGPHPPNPAEILTQEKISALITTLKNRYDRIIFDTPPVLPVSDTINIANIIDGVIFVISHGRIAKEIIKHSKDKLINTGKAPILGAIFNNLDIEARSSYYYYPYYNYRYDTSGKS